MSPVPEKISPTKTHGWRYQKSQPRESRQDTGGLISLYIAVVAAVAVYHLFS